jgi:hypothetical protein
MQVVRDFAKRALPEPLVEWIRRRKALRLYLKELGYEIYYSRTSLDNEEIEERIAARREGAYGRLVKDVLERTDLLVQELDRRIEGQGARVGNELRSLTVAMEEVRASIEELRAWQETTELAPMEDESATAIDAEDPSATIQPDAPSAIGHVGD